MLYSVFSRIFWGFVLTIFELHMIYVDVLPEPIGYYLIFSGINRLNVDTNERKKAKIVAIGLVFLSIPTVFLQNVSVDQIGNQAVLDGWSLYSYLLGIVNLILIFYLFKVMTVVAANWGGHELQQRTSFTFKLYMISMIVMTIFQGFAMNMTVDVLGPFTIFSAIYGFILQIGVLVLLSRFRKQKDGPTTNLNEYKEDES